MKLRQVELYDADTHSRMFCWLTADPRIKQRAIVTLKEIPARSWIVMRVFTTEIDDSKVDVKWGLNLPKSQRTER